MPKRWYKDGICFECTQCGACCTGEPGYVWVTWEESKRLARYLSVSIEDFRSRYVRKIEGKRYSLNERANGDCVFWSHKTGCTVYPERPSQCRTYPFWPENLKSRQSWSDLQTECPGAGKGRFYSLNEIELIRKNDGDASV